MPEADVRTRILDVATRLFGEKGFGSTSVREVVEQAGVTKPTLYYHFGSKEGLFLAAVKEHVSQLGTLVEQAEKVKGPVSSQLHSFVDNYIRRATERPDVVRFLLTLKHTPEDIAEHPQVDLLSMHLHNAQRLEGLLEHGKQAGELRADLNSRVAVQALIGMVNLAAMTAFHGMPVPESQTDDLLDLFLHGVARA